MKKSKKHPGAKKMARKSDVGIVPAGDRVLVRRSTSEEKTVSGIIIPDTTKEKSEEGVIVAVGPGKKNNEGKIISVSFKVGDKVRFSYGDEMKIGGVEYLLVHEDSITALLK